ncbi:hypothetical protein U9M48_011825 [Paspalum notatum var. saurae]|uniref:Uncharacterized protein n=1 Tax=Paspalum notatum var. saurae TaxID=547442 RepID=A0AAQ3WHY3_PASNO
MEPQVGVYFVGRPANYQPADVSEPKLRRGAWEGEYFVGRAPNYSLPPFEIPLVRAQERGYGERKHRLFACLRVSHLASLLKRTTHRATHICTGILAGCTPPTDQMEEQRKRCAAYSQKALVFAVTTFIAYLGSASASTRHMSFKVAMAAFLLAASTDFVSVKRTPKWGSLLTYHSCFLLVLLSYLLLISFNKAYGYALFPVPLPIVLALVRARKLGNTITEAAQDATTNDQVGHAPIARNGDDQDFDGIFNASAIIVTCGGFINIGLGLGRYVVGPDQVIAVSPVGYLFFFTVALGLYLMMATTVRNAALILHANKLSNVLLVLLLCTLTATWIHGVTLSANGSSQVSLTASLAVSLPSGGIPLDGKGKATSTQRIQAEGFEDATSTTTPRTIITIYAAGSKLAAVGSVAPEDEENSDHVEAAE